MVCLHEAKVQLITTQLVRSLGTSRFLIWRVLDSTDVSGGVVVLWDNWVLDLLQEEVGAYSISCHFQNYEDDFKWAFTRVYGHILSEEKEAFWAKLIGIKGLWRDPWRVGGDFNIARFLRENRNCSRSFSYEAFFKDNKRIQVVGFAFDLRSFYLVWGFV